jgi:hypothetical protein
MFALEPLNSTNVSSLLSSQNRVFDAQGTANTISATMSTGGAYAGKQRYVISYAKPTGTLQSRGHDTLHQALADSISGNNSAVKAKRFTSYWSKDEWLAKFNGAPAGLAKDKRQAQPLPAPAPVPLPAPAPTPEPTPIDNPGEENSITDDDDLSITQDDVIVTDGDTTDSTESDDSIATTDEPTEEKSNMGIFAIVGLAIGGIGYYFFSKKE